MSSHSADRWIRDNAGLALLLVGAALVGVGGFAVESAAVATAMVSIGAVAMVLAVLLPRSQGQLKLGPGGLEVVLTAVEQRSEERGLEPELRAEAIAMVLESLGGRGRLHGDLRSENILLPGSSVTTLNFDDLVEQAVEDVSAMVDISPQEVPAEALQAVQDVAELSGSPVVEYAQRRAGRGAPRWHLWTNVGRWRISNTRHGWSARKLDGD